MYLNISADRDGFPQWECIKSMYHKIIKTRMQPTNEKGVNWKCENELCSCAVSNISESVGIFFTHSMVSAKLRQQTIFSGFSVGRWASVLKCLNSRWWMVSLVTSWIVGVLVIVLWTVRGSKWLSCQWKNPRAEWIIDSPGKRAEVNSETTGRSLWAQDPWGGLLGAWFL